MIGNIANPKKINCNQKKISERPLGNYTWLVKMHVDTQFFLVFVQSCSAQRVAMKKMDDVVDAWAPHVTCA